MDNWEKKDTDGRSTVRWEGLDLVVMASCDLPQNQLVMTYSVLSSKSETTNDLVLSSKSETTNDLVLSILLATTDLVLSSKLANTDLVL